MSAYSKQCGDEKVIFSYIAFSTLMEVGCGL